jgi:hypothetical protein
MTEFNLTPSKYGLAYVLCSYAPVGLSTCAGNKNSTYTFENIAPHSHVNQLNLVFFFNIA